MRKLSICLSAFLFVVSGCSVQFTSGGKYPISGIPSSSLPIASIKYSKVGGDSLHVRYKGEEYTAVVPHLLHFSIACKTSEDIILRSYDKTKILIFVLKTKQWSEPKEAPKDCP